ncbi:hypothetical protein AOLI_G00319420 [Acnodon oligacanthus]
MADLCDMKQARGHSEFTEKPIGSRWLRPPLSLSSPVKSRALELAHKPQTAADTRNYRETPNYRKPSTRQRARCHCGTPRGSRLCLPGACHRWIQGAE